jgi:hypothetical protein
VRKGVWEPGDAEYCDGWMGRKSFVYHRERAKCRGKAGDRDAMWPENCNPEHSCAASATRATAASHIRANLEDVCLHCCRVLSRAPTARDPVRDLTTKKKIQRSASPHCVSTSQASGALLPSADTLRPGPATAPLNASGSKDLHRGPDQQA